MRDLKVLLALTVLCTGLLTSCTKQELNEEKLNEKNQITFKTDKPKIRRPGNAN
ncbi:hypothetical protein [Flavivirga aquatica]|uniref:hypothetical protein n=1 Tax=Flavivirga aquatica TaxID=1849968 RepID=UPI0013F4EBF0|nr:hypothetical protein [Flavivirga aquatica]